MSRSSEKSVTHSSDTFLDFAFDMLEYAIPKYGCVWMKPFDYKRRTKKLFRESFGEVVILIRERFYGDKFYERLTSINEEESAEDILLFVAISRNKIFQGKMPLFEIIAYCAFLLDMALICIEIQDRLLLFNIVEDIIDVFDEHIKPFFTIVGGWNSLYKVAEQYAKFASCKLESNPTTSAAKEYFDFLDVDCQASK